MIRCTGKLLLAQIKMLLDRSLMDNGNFHPQLEKGSILSIISEATEILES
jgi:hypothetical protein